MDLDAGEQHLIEKVAAIDLGKAEMVCCVRVPGPARGRAQEVRTFSTMAPSVLAMADWLAGLGVTRVVMEATSDYWKPVFYLLEDTFETWLVNARDVKHLPGRPKTDRLDAVWLCKLAERQMLRPSFVPDPPVRRLRDLTRYRVDLVGVRTAEKQRVEKLLEDAGVKLSVVASDIFGVSGRAMLAALIAGERDPGVLADLARGRMRSKKALLEAAFVARFGTHHAFLLTAMLARVDAANADIAGIEEQITATLGELHDAASRLVTIPGIGACLAVAIIAEVGVDMSRFPTAGHLCSWAKFAPTVHESAGKSKSRPGTGHGNKYLARSLGEAAVMAGRSDTFLGARYRRIARRRGKPRAIVAVGRSILVAIWHILSTPGATFIDLGADYYDSRINPERRVRNHVRDLQALGYRVTLEPAA
ncbi:MAG: IS110 family transposase [Actinomycetota bacterium]|nr:IS110 family transposase [Actinomycetota bacterium]